MGLADFLAEAGGNTVVGHAARAAGGKTTRQRDMDAFINDQLPTLVDQLQKAATREEVMKAGQALIGAGLKAGMNPQGLDKVMEMTVGPALQNLQTTEINKIRSDYGPQPAQPRPPGTEGPLTAGGNFIDPRAERPLDQEGMLRMGQALNANPAGYNQLLRTPAQIGENVAQAKAHEASTAHTEEQIRAEQNKARMIAALSDRPIGNTGVSPQALGTIGGLGQFVTQSMPQREDPLDPDRRKLIEAQTTAANARAGAAGREGRGSAMMQDYIRAGGDPNDQEAFLQFADKYKGAGRAGAEGTETTADQVYGSLDREIDLKTIAKEAQKLGKTKPDDIKAIAASRGIVIEGTPQLTTTGGVFGYGAEPSLTGNFEIKKKPRVTTKTPAGQGRYSEGVPTGSAPTPQAGGRGRGQAPTAAPKRLRFNAKGEQIP